MVLSKDLAPHLTHTVLNTLLGTAPENLTRASLAKLNDALDRVPAGDPTQTLNQLLTPYV
jgi:hypothetical protein